MQHTANSAADLSVHHTMNSHDVGLHVTASHSGTVKPTAVAKPIVASAAPHFHKARIAAVHPARAVPGSVM